MDELRQLVTEYVLALRHTRELRCQIEDGMKKLKRTPENIEMVRFWRD